MKIYQQEPVQARLMPVGGEYLQTRYQEKEDGLYEIRVGMGGDWSALRCKEVYGKAMKTCLELELKSCVVDLTPAVELGRYGICAAMEGVYGGAYQKKFALTKQWEPEIDLYAGGSGLAESALQEACILARAVIETRNRVNCPSNLMRPAAFAESLVKMAEGLPVDVRVYSHTELAELGLEALLSVGNSSAHPPMMVVLRYDGAKQSAERLGLVGKGITVDSGGYCLKPASSMEGIKGDMAGGAAAAAALCALAENGARVNVTAVIPICENRISDASLLPGDVIRSLSGMTIEVLNTDAEGRLILADGLAWAAQKEKCTCLVDIATLTGAIWAMLGHVATGVMANHEGLYERLKVAAESSGEKFWRMPAFAEYEKLIASDYADVRNTSKDGCGAIAAGLFLKRFAQGLPWMHLDIAGTADNKGIVWEHQVPGATGTPVSTLYHLARLMEEA